MGAGLTAWRRFGAAFAALVLAVLALGPSLDGVLCAGDAPSAVQVAVSLGSPGADAHDHERTDGCAHGHCHHGAPQAPEPAVAPAAPLAYAAARLTPAKDAASPAGRQFDLMRPPRA